MNLCLLAILAGSALAGRLDSNYLPLSSAVVQLNNALVANTHAGPVPPPAAIIRLNSSNNGDGTYRFDFETENRIAHQERGELKNAGTEDESNVIEGSYSYTGPDGVVYTIHYVADENGFRASGDHLPTAAPIPEDIADAVQQNEAEEAAGIVDDGQYRPGTVRKHHKKFTYQKGHKY